MKYFIILLLYPFAFHYSISTAADSSGDYHFQIAEELYAAGIYDSSSYHYNLAADFYFSSGKWKECIISKNYSGTNYRYLSKYNEAFKRLNDALSICLDKFGETDSLLADIYNSIGSAYYEKEDFENALIYYEKSLDISLLHWGDNHKNTGRGYHNLGLIFYRTGNAEEALNHFNKALAIWLPGSGGKTSNIGNCFINLANTYYFMEEYDKVIEYDLKALEVWKEVLGDEHQYIAMSYNNLSDDYTILKKYDEALIYSDKSISLREKIFGTYHPETAFSITHIAKLYTSMKDYENADIFFDSTLTILNNFPEHPHRFEALLEQGKFYLLMGKPDKALENFNAVLNYIYPRFNEENSDIDSLIKTGQFRPTKLDWWTAFIYKGDAFYKKYSESSEESALLNAYKNYRKFAAVFKSIRKNFRSETSKIVLGKHLYLVNARLIKTALNLYDLTGIKGYKEDAFYFAEETKSAVLQDAINESGAKKFAGIPDSLLSKEKFIKGELSFINTRILEAENNNENSSKILNLQKKLFDLNNEYDELISYFEINYPQYFRLKFQDNNISVSEIQSGLNPGSALLEYFVEDSLIYIYSISKNKFDIKYLKNPGLTEIVKEFRRSLNNLDYKSYLKTSKNLYSLLIEPVKENLQENNKIFIIPDGILNHLPFEALISDADENSEEHSDFSSLNYLIKKYEIIYHFSADFLFNNKDASPEKELSFIGFAPVFPNEKENEKNNIINAGFLSPGLRSITVGNETYSPLPESEREVKEIYNLFKSKELTGNIYTYNKAHERMIKSEEIEKYSCIQLATHGFINEKYPKLSGLLFYQHEKSGEDGLLYSGEIYNLKLKADLIVLSACESGLGKLVKGEGIIGLTRGFIYAGAKNVVVSLWQVDDKSTAELMIEFYKNILSGIPYSSALREAKLKLINDGIYSYPLDWSPFILMGSN